MKNVNLITSILLLWSYSILNCQTIQQLGYFNINGTFALSSKSNFMVLGNGNIIDISNPANPKVAGSIGFSGFSSSVLVSGNYSYFGLGMRGELVIADISIPSAPVQIASRVLPSISSGIFGLAKSNTVLYLAAGGDGIYSINVSNNSKPIVLDSVEIPNGQARDIITHANFAYVAHGNGLKVLDISNPAKIKLVATIGFGYISIAIDTTNNLVFLGKDSEGIDVFNIANPYFPVSAFSILNSGGTAWDIKYRDNLVYLTTNSSGLFIYKIVGNAGIQMVNFPNTNNGQSFAVALQDSLILLSGLIKGVAILKYDSLGVTGTQVETSLDPISILQNPASDFIEFRLGNEVIGEIEIVNYNGVTVHVEKWNKSKSRIDISNLPNGSYFVIFKNKHKNSTRKLIKLN